MKSINYPAKYYDEIAHAIAGQSFRANIEVNTLESRIIQDADRLDGLRAIGIARCFATAGLLKRSFYNFSKALPKFEKLVMKVRNEICESSIMVPIFFLHLTFLLIVQLHLNKFQIHCYRF